MILPIIWLVFSIIIYGEYYEKFNPTDFKFDKGLNIKEEYGLKKGDIIRITENLILEYD